MDPQAQGPAPGRPLPPPPDFPPPPALPAPRPRRSPGRVIGAVVVVLVALAAGAGGLALSASSGSSSAGAASGAPTAQVGAEALWRTATADAILPPVLKREGTEEYYRLAVDANEGCAQLPAAFLKALAPGGCAHLLQATYIDSTQTVVATVGVVVVGGSAAQHTALFQSWTADSYARQYAMMPYVFGVATPPAASFHNTQRIAWKSAISNDGAYLAFAVSGFADGRSGPSAAAFGQGNESELQSDSPPVQAADDLSGYILTGIASLEPGAQSAGAGA